MPPGVPAVADGVEVDEGSADGVDDGPVPGDVGRVLGCGWSVPVRVGVDAGGAVAPSDGEDVGLEPGAAGDRS